MPTKIEWTDETWNPITGCEPISEGCENCYARRLFGRNLWRYDFTPGTRHMERFSEPGEWKKPRRIFVCSMGDLFHDEVSFSDILDVMSLARTYSRHTYIFLTKRPERMAQYVKEYERNRLPDNVWLGVTAEKQKRADERIPILLQIPAAIRFVSVEPMLEAVDLSEWLSPCSYYCDHDADGGGHRPQRSKLHWVIAGPETGPGKRLCKTEWLRDLYLECDNAGVPFFLKKHDDGKPVNSASLQQYPENYEAHP
jgi:protein gp37